MKNILKIKNTKFLLMGAVVAIFSLIGSQAAFAEQAATENFPTRGSKEAKISITEFSDFQCPFCYRVVPTLQKLIEEYPEQLNWVFRHNPLRNTPGQGSFAIHESSVCAQEQGKFWAFHDRIFQVAGSKQNRSIDQVIEDIDIDAEKYSACMVSGTAREKVLKDSREGKEKGVQGTPSVFIGPYIVSGAYPYEYFKQLVEFVLNPENTIPPDPLVRWSSESKPIEFKDLEGRPSKGPENASVTLVEFSDFHCPFCKRLAPVFEELMKAHEGNIRQVWRHHPLKIHPRAAVVHRASECAHEQGKFWKFHKAFFGPGRVASNDETLRSIARSLGMQMKNFEKCMESPHSRELVEKDMIAGRIAGVHGTPTIFINGKKLVGAYPFEHYDSVIKDELNSLN